MSVESVIKVVAASCVIHNICEMQNEPFFDEWLQEGFQAPHVAAFAGPSAEAGADIRDTRLPCIFSPQKGKVPETDDLLLLSLLFIHLMAIVLSYDNK